MYNTIVPERQPTTAPQNGNHLVYSKKRTPHYSFTANRHINLLNTHYKIIERITATRLRPTVPGLLQAGQQLSIVYFKQLPVGLDSVSYAELTLQLSDPYPWIVLPLVTEYLTTIHSRSCRVMAAARISWTLFSP
jgi:hypothetical protein